MTSVIEISPAKPVARTFRASQALERFVVPVLLIAGWESGSTDCPGFPRDGSWQVQHEGFPVWP